MSVSLQVALIALISKLVVYEPLPLVTKDGEGFVYLDEPGLSFFSLLPLWILVLHGAQVRRRDLTRVAASISHRMISNSQFLVGTFQCSLVDLLIDTQNSVIAEVGGHVLLDFYRYPRLLTLPGGCIQIPVTFRPFPSTHRFLTMPCGDLNSSC